MKLDDLGRAEAPDVRAVVFGHTGGRRVAPGDAENALATLRDDTGAAGRQVQAIADHWASGRGALALVWRDTRSGALKRSAGGETFDQETDRLELAFARLDAAALSPTAPVPGPAAAAEARRWVDGLIARARPGGPGRPRFEPGLAIASVWGGPVRLSDGNIAPEPAEVGRYRRDGFDLATRIKVAADARASGRANCCVLVVYRYEDRSGRVPTGYTLSIRSNTSFKITDEIRYR
jgi:hypothetical protein